MVFKLNFKSFFAVLLLLSFQILFLRDFSLGSYAFCFIYLWPIVKSPIEVKPVKFIIFAFLLGWTVDIFYDTHGMHAAACLAVAYFRPFLIKVLTPTNGYDERAGISLRELSWLWFLPYVFTILFAHHIILFFLESSDSSLFSLSFLRAFISAILGLVIFILFELFSMKESI
jgi:hypothetical protein